jgi:hypothetical protein
MSDGGLTEDDIKPGNKFDLGGRTVKPTKDEKPKKKKKGVIERMYYMMHGHKGPAGEYYN